MPATFLKPVLQFLILPVQFKIILKYLTVQFLYLFLLSKQALKSTNLKIVGLKTLVLKLLILKPPTLKLLFLKLAIPVIAFTLIF